MTMLSSTISPRKASRTFHFFRSEASVHYSRRHSTRLPLHYKRRRCRSRSRGFSSVRQTFC
jgi:hypothetical protein